MLNKIKSVLMFIVWELIPMHFLMSLLLPNRFDKENNKPSTLLIWLIGLYTAIYGFTIQIYENSMNVAKSQLESVYMVKQQRYQFYLISKIQNTKIPLKPRFQNVITTVQSFLGKKEQSNELIELTTTFLKNQTDSIVDASLYNIDLSNIIFKKTKFKNVYFSEGKFATFAFDSCEFISCSFNNTNLSKVQLSNSNLNGTFFVDCNLFKSLFFQCDLKFTSFIRSNLDSTSFHECNLDSTDFSNANLKTTRMSTSNIANVLSFYAAKLDSNLLKQLIIESPKKLDSSSKDDYFMSFQRWNYKKYGL